MENLTHKYIAAIVIFGIGLSTAPLAQSQSSSITLTASESRTPDTFIDGPALPTLRINEYQTRLLGLLQGNVTLFYDQTFSGAFGSALVDDAVLAAMSSLTIANAGNPLSFLGPTLDGSVETSLGNNSVTQLNDPLITLTVAGFGTFGPGSLPFTWGGTDVLPYTGVPMFCEGLSNSVPTHTEDPRYSGTTVIGGTIPFAYPFGCTGGVLFTVEAGRANIHTNVNSQYQFTRQIQITDSYRIFDTYSLIGVPQAFSVPEPGSALLLAFGLMLLMVWTPRNRAGRTGPIAA